MRKWLLVLWLIASVHPRAEALPHWARQYHTRCNTCHTVVPKLNARGQDFLARGYRPDPDLNQQPEATLPLSVWLTQNFDRRVPRDQTNDFLGKVELISGGPIGDHMSYFVEWRPVSLEAQAAGGLRDRSGRFEDLWLGWQFGHQGRFNLILGQYRPLGQIDPGRKLSISTNALFDTSLEGDRAATPRLTSLRGFSTAGRQPAITLGYRSVAGEAAMDGLFHNVTLLFPGEFSIPLNAQARRTASFEIEGRPKGVLLETYYRSGLNSVGAHAFMDRGRWLVVGVGEVNFGNLFATAGLGVDHRPGQASRLRSSLELEYHPLLEDDSSWRTALGFRWEDVSRDGRPSAYIPYIAVSGPNTEAITTLMQLEYFGQAGHERLRLDFSLSF